MKLSHRSINLLATILLGSAVLGGCAAQTAGSDDQNIEESAQSERVAKFEIYQDAAGEYRFRLKAGNGQIILASEGYVSKGGAENGVESVKTHGVDLGYYEVLEADSGEHYFVLKAANHEIIGVSEMYASKSNATRGTETVRENVAKLLRHEAAVEGGAGFDLFRDAAEEYRFNLVAANGEIVLSSEGYVAKSGALNGIESVRKNGRDLESYEIREATDGSFYFVLKAANHEIIGVSEMYVSKSNAERGAETVADLLYSERVADPQ